MAFKKGTSGNPDGRRKGAANKMTAELRERIKDFLDGQWERIERDFDNLEPDKRVALFEKLLQYVLPRMASMDLEGELDFKVLSEETLDKIADRLINKER